MVLTLLLADSRTSFWRTLALTALAGCLIYFINISIEHEKFVLTNTYANYTILNSDNSPIRKDEKYLVMADGV